MTNHIPIDQNIPRRSARASSPNNDLRLSCIYPIQADQSPRGGSDDSSSKHARRRLCIARRRLRRVAGGRRAKLRQLRHRERLLGQMPQSRPAGVTHPHRSRVRLGSRPCRRRGIRRMAIETAQARSTRMAKRVDDTRDIVSGHRRSPLAAARRALAYPAWAPASQPPPNALNNATRSVAACVCVRAYASSALRRLRSASKSCNREMSPAL